MHFEKLTKGICFELGFPHMNRPGSLTLVNPLWPHGFFCSWKENERKMKRKERKMKGKWKENERNMKGKWKENESNEQPSGILIRSRVPQTLLTLLTLWGGVINPLLALQIITYLYPGEEHQQEQFNAILGSLGSPWGPPRFFDFHSWHAVVTSGDGGFLHSWTPISGWFMMEMNGPSYWKNWTIRGTSMTLETSTGGCASLIEIDIHPWA